jgi:hypothetical protein
MVNCELFDSLSELHVQKKIFFFGNFFIFVFMRKKFLEITVNNKLSNNLYGIHIQITF